MKKFLVTIFIVAIFAPIALLAQGATEPVAIDLAVVASIIATGLFGIPAASLVQVIKKALKWKDGKVRLIALVVSAACVAAYLVPLGLFKWYLFVTYTVVVWAESTGLFKMTKSKTG